MSDRFPQLIPPQPAPMRLVQATRPDNGVWHSSLPLGEMLMMVSFGLVLVLA